jgi:DNA-binding NtrC family response regulator
MRSDLWDAHMPCTTVLVVDDEPLIRWSLAERLKAEGHRVLNAETGAAALKSLPEGIDLVLLDYNLPDTNGLSVLRKIKEFDANIPVVMLSAYAPSDVVDEAMRSGAYDVVGKPFDLDRLTRIVAAALEAAPGRCEQCRTNSPVRVLSSASRRPLQRKETC